MYFDFCCPYCYLAQGYLARMREGTPLEVEWVPWEIAPETPPGGTRRPWRGLDRLRGMGEPVDRPFADLAFTPHTREALQAVEHAKPSGRADALVERLFRGFFAEGRDLGNRETLLRLAEEAGMERVDLGEALDRGTHLPTLVANDRRAEEELHLEVVPSFLRGGRLLLAGSTTLTFPEFREAFPRLLP
ncbi:DsbA family oxidoreductase [Aminomonas paucivorans]|uniref:DsbA family oxidoreductase n=1 Tax=Aminomonas paucivorans TaxID=81412 RepID=UPI00331FDEA5